MSKPIRTLLIAAANNTSRGGEKHVADLLKRLPAAGIEVSLACPEGGSLSALADSLDIARYPVPIRLGMSPAKLASVRRAIEASQADIVHAHGGRAALFARLADKRAAERVVYTVHGIHADRAGSTARKVIFLSLERLQRSRTAHFIAVCESDVGKGVRLGILDSAKTSVVYNGIELPALPQVSGAFRAELGLDSATPLALCIGRFHEQKDHVTLLHAWRAVLDREPSAVLALVGWGGMEDELHEVAVTLGLGAGMRFVAPRSDIEPVYADSDIFVLSSLWEGLPYVLLEAMAYRLPVVSTNVDGIPEAVVDGKTGVLVEPSDPAVLATAVLELIADPSRREAMGVAGRAHVAEQFSLDKMVDGTLRAYRQVTGRS